MKVKNKLIINIHMYKLTNVILKVYYQKMIKLLKIYNFYIILMKKLKFLNTI